MGVIVKLSELNENKLQKYLEELVTNEQYAEQNVRGIAAFALLETEIGNKNYNLDDCKEAIEYLEGQIPKNFELSKKVIEESKTKEELIEKIYGEIKTYFKR